MSVCASEAPAVPAGVGEPSAWEGLEDLRDGLRAFLVRQCPDENEVEDVIQETFLRAARYRRRRHVQSLRPWALRIALNVLANARRRVVRTQAALGDEPFDPPEAEPETAAGDSFAVEGLALDGEVARELLLLGLGGLRARDRAVLDSFYAGHEQAAVAAVECGIPRHLVKVRLYRARQRLRQLLARMVRADARWRRMAS
jgi:RNA polymerase sigma factor (sigma-70 family)